MKDPLVPPWRNRGWFGFSFNKKLLGRLKHAYDSCKLKLVGGDFNGQAAKFRHFSRHLPILSQGRIDNIPAFNARLPQVTERMLLVGGSILHEESYIEGLGGSDFQNLPEMATQVALGRGPLTVIRLVYGATTEMPLRALSYLLPALVYMEHTRSAVSQLQVIFVNNISSRLDRIDTRVASKQAKAFAGIAQDYIRNFFPYSDDKVVFLEDTPLDKGSDLRRRLLMLTTSLKKIAPEDILNDLVRKAVNNGSGRTYAFYGAAHTLIHDIDIPESLVPLLPDQPETEPNPDVIISMGGRKEEIFYRLRHALKPHLDPEYNNAKTLQFFTRHRVPPYYMTRGGDVALDDVVRNGFNIGGANFASVVNHDLDYLLDVSRTRGNLYSFLREHRRRGYG